jgi:hypothetical protein
MCKDSHSHNVAYVGILHSGLAFGAMLCTVPGTRYLYQVCIPGTTPFYDRHTVPGISVYL